MERDAGGGHSEAGCLLMNEEQKADVQQAFFMR